MAKHRTSSDIRECILATATRLFHSQGYRATGVNQIIAEAGVAKASFYAHFPSKGELGRAFLERRHEKWSSLVESVLTDAPTPRRKILALFDLWQTQIDEDGFRGCAFVNMAGEFPDPGTPVRAHVKDHKRAMRELFGSLVIAYDDGKHDERYALAVADAIYLLFNSAITECRNFCDTWPIAAAKDAAERMLSSLDEQQ